MVRCITIDPKGQYFMSASDDGTCKVGNIRGSTPHIKTNILG